MLSFPNVLALLGEGLGAWSSGQLLAYIGPGAGLAGLVVAIALILGAVLLVAGLVWYPLKRVLNNRRAEAATGTRADHAE